jgi:hypothetical protein
VDTTSIGIKYDARSTASDTIHEYGSWGENLKPDLITRRFPAPTTQADEELMWSIVETVWELKSNAGMINDSKNLIGPSALRAASILQDQYGYRRGHVVSVGLCHKQMRVMVFDRSGGCASQPFSIVDDPRLFVRIVVGCLVADDATLGFALPDSDDTFRLTLAGTEFVVQRQPFVVPAFDTLSTRGTTCWRATWAGSRPPGWPSDAEDAWPLVLKSSWPYSERPPEGRMLAGLRDDPGVPDVIAWGVAKLHDEDYTTNSSRGGFTMRTLHRCAVWPYGTRGAGTKAKSTRNRHSSSSRQGRVAKRPQRRASAYSVPPEAAQFHMRTNHLTVMTYVGRPFRASELPASKLFAVLSVAVATIGRLYTRHGIMHRDISSRNILVAEGRSFTQRKNPWAALIDFDMAINRTSPATQIPERTGTLKYMALLLLDSNLRVPHLPWFDLESVFWYIVIEAMHESLLDHYAAPLNTAVSLERMHDAKLRFLESFTRFRASVDGNSVLSPAIKALWKVLEIFRGALLGVPSSGLRFSYGVEQPIVFGASLASPSYQPPLALLPGAENPFASTPHNARVWVDNFLGQVLPIGRQHCDGLVTEHRVFGDGEAEETYL